MHRLICRTILGTDWKEAAWTQHINDSEITSGLPRV